MKTNERQKRIQTSKYFFFNLSNIESEIQLTTESIEKLIHNSTPAEYKQNLRIQNLRIQETKKNYSTEATLGDVEEISEAMLG